MDDEILTIYCFSLSRFSGDNAQVNFTHQPRPFSPKLLRKIFAATQPSPIVTIAGSSGSLLERHQTFQKASAKLAIFESV